MVALENTFIGRPGMSKTRCRTLFSLRSARNCCNSPSSSMTIISTVIILRYSIPYICVLVQMNGLAAPENDYVQRRWRSTCTKFLAKRRQRVLQKAPGASLPFIMLAHIVHYLTKLIWTISMIERTIFREEHHI